MIRNSHDHRVKQLVVETRDPKLFEEFGVKPSTARNWIYKGFSTPIIYENVQMNKRASAFEEDPLYIWYKQ